MDSDTQVLSGSFDVAHAKGVTAEQNAENFYHDAFELVGDFCGFINSCLNGEVYEIPGTASALKPILVQRPYNLDARPAHVDYRGGEPYLSVRIGDESGCYTATIDYLQRKTIDHEMGEMKVTGTSGPFEMTSEGLESLTAAVNDHLLMKLPTSDLSYIQSLELVEDPKPDELTSRP